MTFKGEKLDGCFRKMDQVNEFKSIFKYNFKGHVCFINYTKLKHLNSFKREDTP